MGAAVTQSLLYLFCAFFLTVLITPFLIRIASRQGWLDRPNFRKIHRTPIPRLGGIAVFIGIWVTWAIFSHRNPTSIPYESVRPLWALFIATTLIWLLGIYDDLIGANAWQKLIVQIAAALIVVKGGIVIKLLHNPLGSDFLLSSDLLVWVLTVTWIVVVTNSINLIDGLDGLASGVCFITSLSLFFIAKDLGSPHLPMLALCIGGACLGFLVFNFSPARIFLGDSGSLVLGFLLACLSMMGTAKRSTAIVMFGPPLILALPVADASLAVLRRFFRDLSAGKPRSLRAFFSPAVILQRFREIFNADQEHIHHALVQVGLSHRGAVVILYCVTLVLGVSAYRMAITDHLSTTFVVIVGLSLGLIWLRRKVKRSKLR